MCWLTTPRGARRGRCNASAAFGHPTCPATACPCGICCGACLLDRKSALPGDQRGSDSGSIAPPRAGAGVVPHPAFVRPGAPLRAPQQRTALALLIGGSPTAGPVPAAAAHAASSSHTPPAAGAAGHLAPRQSTSADSPAGRCVRSRGGYAGAGGCALRSAPRSGPCGPPPRRAPVSADAELINVIFVASPLGYGEFRERRRRCGGVGSSNAVAAAFSGRRSFSHRERLQAAARRRARGRRVGEWLDPSQLYVL